MNKWEWKKEKKNHQVEKKKLNIQIVKAEDEKPQTGKEEIINKDCERRRKKEKKKTQKRKTKNPTNW